MFHLGAKSDAQQQGAIDHEELQLHKRLPRKLQARRNDVYVSNRTDFSAQLVRCRKLLQTGLSEIYIHGLGSAMNRAINLALRLEAESHGRLKVAANTSTVELVDDIEPQADNVEADTQVRNNSAIHLKVYVAE